MIYYDKFVNGINQPFKPEKIMVISQMVKKLQLITP